jgi:hypothetical protein
MRIPGLSSPGLLQICLRRVFAALPGLSCLDGSQSREFPGCLEVS